MSARSHSHIARTINFRLKKTCVSKPQVDLNLLSLNTISSSCSNPHRDREVRSHSSSHESVTIDEHPVGFRDMSRYALLETHALLGAGDRGRLSFRRSLPKRGNYRSSVGSCSSSSYNPEGYSPDVRKHGVFSAGRKL